MTTIRDPFRPFVAVDDGARLVLTRRRSAADWLLRGALYWLLALVVVLMGLIPYAAWTRGSGVGDVVLAVVLLTLTWFVLQLVMLGFHVDGVRRIAVGPGEVVLDARGALLRRRVRATDVVAIEARTTTTSTRHGDVRWLRLQARTGAGTLDLGALHLDAAAEPTREAAAEQAAETLAARLGVPLVREAGPSSG